MERVERNAALGDEGEMVIHRVVEERGGEEAARGGDQRRRGPLGPLRRDEPAVECALSRRRGRRRLRRIGVDVDVEEGLVALKETVPERGEVEIGVGEEQEGYFRLHGQSREGAVVAAVVVVGGGEGGAAEEGEVVDLVG